MNQTRLRKPLTILALLICGASVTYLFRYSHDFVSAGKTGHNHSFHHPFFQTVIMFIAEALCLLFFFLGRHASSFPDFRNLWGLFFLLAFLDLLSSTMQLAALMWIETSLYLALKSVGVIFTALLSYSLLRAPIKCIPLLGLVLVMFGVFLLGYLNGMTNQHQENALPNALVVFSQIAMALWQVLAQYLLVQRKVPVLGLVGVSGTVGVFLSSIVCLIFYFIRMPSSELPGNRMEDPVDAIWQMSQSPWLVGVTAMLVVSLLALNILTLEVTGQYGATTAMVYESLQNVVLWILPLVVAFSGGDEEGVKRETQEWPFKVVGCVVLLVGAFVYELFNPRLPGKLTRSFTESEVGSDLRQPLTNSSIMSINSALGSSAPSAGSGDAPSGGSKEFAAVML